MKFHLICNGLRTGELLELDSDATQEDIDAIIARYPASRRVMIQGFERTIPLVWKLERAR